MGSNQRIPYILSLPSLPPFLVIQSPPSLFLCSPVYLANDAIVILFVKTCLSRVTNRHDTERDIWHLKYYHLVRVLPLSIEVLTD